MKKIANHPQWALAQKKPGTELRCIRGKYYLYECSSFYDKELKKTRKKTGRYLGMITEEKGLVPPKRRQVEIENENLSDKAKKGSDFEDVNQGSDTNSVSPENSKIR